MKTVEPLVGLKSFWAMQSYHKLLLGIKMIPEYSQLAYEDFYAVVEMCSPEDKEKIIRKAVLLVNLESDEAYSLMAFCKDPNGVPYGRVNTTKMAPDEMFEILVSVCLEISQIKIKFVTEAEKKN
jgi:hypothetical protein